MLKNTPLSQTLKRNTNAAIPVPRAPTSDPSSVVYAVSPSPSVSAGPTPASGSATPAVGGSDDMARRVVDAKRRVSEATTKLAVKDNPYMVCIPSPSLEFVLTPVHSP